MGFSGINIPGHRGTQFRHRKVFQNKRKPIIKSEKSKALGKDIYPEYSYSDLQKARAEHKKVHLKMFLWICIPSVLLFVVYMNYLDKY